MDLNDYLNEAKKVLNTTHDSKLASKLHITSAGVCAMRNNGSIGDDTAMYLGKILNIEPAIILLNARAAKSKNSRVVASVRRILQRIETTTAGLMITGYTLPSLMADAAHCILCKIKYSLIKTDIDRVY